MSPNRLLRSLSRVKSLCVGSMWVFRGVFYDQSSWPITRPPPEGLCQKELPQDVETGPHHRVMWALASDWNEKHYDYKSDPRSLSAWLNKGLVCFKSLKDYLVSFCLNSTKVAKEVSQCSSPKVKNCHRVLIGFKLIIPRVYQVDQDWWFVIVNTYIYIYSTIHKSFGFPTETNW